MPSFLFALPFVAFSSTTYTFSVSAGPTGPTEGFSYVAPDYIQGSSLTLQTQDLASCDVSAFPSGWICVNAGLTQLPGEVLVFANFQSTSQPNDPSGHSGASATFINASLTRDGNYLGSVASFSSNPTLTIQTTHAAIPEPRTWALLGTGWALGSGNDLGRVLPFRLGKQGREALGGEVTWLNSQ